MSEDLKNKLLEVVQNHKVGTLATISQNKPFSRFMLFFNEDLVLYTATNKDTHKVEDINANPNVHILLGNDCKGWDDPYVEVEGTVMVEESKELKEKFWNEHLKSWIPSADDPNYMLLKISPSSYRYFEKSSSEPETLSL
ncbi:MULTISPECIES: pyridoxamine 5'-phosphate oxidase family protein [Metabacillus]|uniref:Pyridoxamine 5'-phosphate oxidase family protein n=1 Tax=Metabacillus endolithicus TaxID=1535204 RepID=A0ABW5C6M7_9BACI|nr:MULTISPECIES: pyridoxamine 5'-phosphate oxidase family protein [Metabacillus]UGB31435.1 pyridoxamine 5'-phosphate oxidase family protein [Metabacillus sp. B2-18]UHA60576.1 pyridoxamine 5'-phosphate oxidase family protein [Metabacillus litoralis]UPG62091.1 pyridoxamine 5'-phosphate oxidase family protein [Metabacillus endolithicus]